MVKHTLWAKHSLSNAPQRFEAEARKQLTVKMDAIFQELESADMGAQKYPEIVFDSIHLL